MKTKFFLLMLMLFATTTAGRAQSIGAFLSDNDGPYTNVRNAPSGKIVAKIDHKNSPTFVLDSPKDGWWHIVGNSYEIAEEGTEVTLKGSKTGYWIHHSVVAIATRNYGGETLKLRKRPSGKSAVTWSFKEETTLHPIEVSGTWVKVRTADGKHTGWIEEEWLCDNPLTNCC